MNDPILTWSLYDPSSGLFSGHQFTGHASTLKAHLAQHPGLAAIGGAHDALSKRVRTDGTVEDWQPPQPTADHEWDAPTRRWRLTPAAAAREAATIAARARIEELEVSAQPRAIREALLGISDGKERLQAIEDRIAHLRASLTQSDGSSVVSASGGSKV